MTNSDISPVTETLTPMMRQYQAIKQAHSDCLLFYRMGDFYELFFDDAIKAAEALDIVLTRRGKHEANDIPMCGVPAHSHESYLQKLIRAGFKVAVCEQLETPEQAKKRGAKSVVQREVVRIVTPGTLTEDALLEAKSSNYLCALNQVKSSLALAWADISTGIFEVALISPQSLSAELSRLSPSEILLPDRLLEDKEIASHLSEWKQKLSPYAHNFFDKTRGQNAIRQFFGVASLESFGAYDDAELGACGAIIEYIKLTQKASLPALSYPRQYAASDFLVIDAATRRNLELTHTQEGQYKGSLLQVIDRTVTAPGGRLLYQYLAAPLRHATAINARLAAVEFFTQYPELRKQLRRIFSQIPDMERALMRLCAGRGYPRDMGAMKEGLKQCLSVLELLEYSDKRLVPSLLLTAMAEIDHFDELALELSRALKPDPLPLNLAEGGFIAENYHAALDHLRNARELVETEKDRLREQYRAETGIEKLKILENNILGFFVEVTAQQAAKIPASFIHRQTMVNAVRFTTPELRELEAKVINAREQSIAMEIDIFNQLVEKLKVQSQSIQLAAQALARLDVWAALAELSVERRYVKPEMVETAAFHIQKGRHPVVERAVSPFIANDCMLEDAQKLWLITGPNMAGKSTFLRQNALIAILAHMGSFVPAEAAKISTMDRVFSRVGAADNLARGQSTFMVEMVETATILNQATERSFIILDEIGRGTSTYDGLSIAWAVMEYLHNITKARTLFATHYHELTSLKETLPAMKCYTMHIKEWQDNIIFLHEIVPGTADRSYGIHVAKLAGLPRQVIQKAGQVLKLLQNKENATHLPLFMAAEPQAKESHPVLEKLQAVNPDQLSPKQALELIYELVAEARE